MTRDETTTQPVGGYPRRTWWKWIAGVAAVALLAAIGSRQLLRSLTEPTLLAQLPSLPDLSSAKAPMAQQLRQADAAARRDVHSANRVGRLGMAYHANLFYDQAAPCYQLAANLDPRDHRWPYYLGLLRETAGRTGQALPLIQRAAELSPEAPWVRYRLATILLKLGRLDEAQQAYRKIVQTETHRAHGLLGLAEVAKRQGEWQKVIDLLAPAVEEDPEFGPARHALAAAYEALDNPAEARVILPLTRNIPTTLPARDPLINAIDDLSCSSSHLLKQATLAQRSRDNTRAGELLERLVRIAPEDVDGHLAFSAWLQYTAASLGDTGAAADAEYRLRRALEEARTAAKQDGESAMARAQAGAVLLDLGELDAAIDSLTQALELDPNLNFAHGNLEFALVEAGRYEEAISQCRAAAELYPADPTHLNCLGMALQRSGDVDGALSSWYRALEVDPAHNPARFNLAQELINRGELGAAAGHLRAILGYEPDHRQARELYAWVLGQIEAGEGSAR